MTESKRFLGSVAAGGASARRGEERALPLYVAPTTGRAVNTIRAPLRALACWRIDDVRFDFDSSFVLPEGSNEFALLAKTRPPGAGGDLMSVFGHADPSGEDDYNKTLSGRRARAVYGLLVRDADIWLDLLDHDFGGDHWGTRACQLMLTALGHDAGEPDDEFGPSTAGAVKSFQQAAGLPQSSSLDRGTKRALALVYMDALCVDASGQPFSYEKADFLGRGTGRDAKAAVQGCSEFNPVLVFSQAQAARFRDPALEGERNARNLTNRRVVVLMFPSNIDFAPQRWPCPTTNEGPLGCQKQFWADGTTRRNPRGDAREHLRHDKTFACAFYDRLTRDSPCEGVRKVIRINLFDQDGQPLAGAPYRLTVGPEAREGTSGPGGVVLEANVLAGGTCLLEWSKTPGPQLSEDDEDPTNPRKQHRGANARGFTFEREVILARSDDDLDNPDNNEETAKHFHNLGYIREPEPQRRRSFEDDYGPGISVAEAHQQGIAEKQV